MRLLWAWLSPSSFSTSSIFPFLSVFGFGFGVCFTLLWFVSLCSERMLPSSFFGACHMLVADALIMQH